MKARETTPFEVIVTDLGKRPGNLQVASINGMIVYQYDVPTKGIVGIKIVGCDNLTCHSQSSTLQPILRKGQNAKWYWRLTAGAPGPAMIMLRADTYAEGSTVPLSEEIIHVKGHVISTPAYATYRSHKRIAHTEKGILSDINILGIVAAAIVSIGTIVGAIIGFAKRRRRKTPGTPDTPSEDRRAADTSEGAH
jgi:hypothetical protein